MPMTDDDDAVVDTPRMTSEQVEKGCWVEDGKVMCPTPQQVSSNDIDDGMTKIKLGDQRIKSVRCFENKKTGDLECTVQSKSKQ